MITIFFLILFFSMNSSSSESFPELYGCFCEGGIITGQLVDKGNITINNKKIKTFENGRFIYAFGRKSKNIIKLEINGEIREFEIKKKSIKLKILRAYLQTKLNPQRMRLREFYLIRNK